MDRVIQLLINAAALYVAVLVVDGLDFDFGREGAWLEFILVALIFGLVNTFLKPVLRLLTLPITMVTLGLTVDGFVPALLGSIVISIVGWLLSMVIGAGRKAT